LDHVQDSLYSIEIHPEMSSFYSPSAYPLQIGAETFTMEATPAESGAPSNLVNSNARQDELEEINRGDQCNASNPEPMKEEQL